MSGPPLPDALASGAERLFAALSAGRGRRIFHPDALPFRARLVVAAGVGRVPVLVAPGALEVGERLPDVETSAPRFDAWRSAGGLVPWGRVNALRAPAYRGSRRGRGAEDQAGRTAGSADGMPKPNPNRIDRQKKPDAPPPRFQGERDTPGDQTNWEAVGHEAEAQRRTGDAVPAPHGNAAGGRRPKPPRTRE